MRSALGDVGVVDLGPGEAQEVLALEAEQALLHRGVAQQVAHRRVREQVAVEGRHQGVGVLLEGGAELGEERAVHLAVVEVGDALLERFGKRHTPNNGPASAARCQAPAEAAAGLGHASCIVGTRRLARGDPEGA